MSRYQNQIPCLKRFAAMRPLLAFGNFAALIFMLFLTGCQTPPQPHEFADLNPAAAGTAQPGTTKPADPAVAPQPAGTAAVPQPASNAVVSKPPDSTAVPKFTEVGVLPKPADSAVLHEGDTVRVSFPGAPNLNPGVQQVRPDGKISLPLIGEFKAAGLTTAQVQSELINLYADKLQSKEVVVTLEASSFTVYVSGAVLRPGKVTADRPLTVLQAIMDAGGFDMNRANLKKVAVIRHAQDRTERYTLNLKRVMDGQDTETVILKSQDMIFVPERFNWF